MVTHLEQDIKKALGSITKKKASGGNEFLTELFQILKDNAKKKKDNAVKVLHPIGQQI